MLRYTPRVPNQKLSISHWFPITEAAKSGFRRVKDGGVNDPPTAGNDLTDMKSHPKESQFDSEITFRPP